MKPRRRRLRGAAPPSRAHYHGNAKRQTDLRAAIDRFNLDHPVMDLVVGLTTLRKTGSTGGGEYHGPCPACPDGGTDRFYVHPDLGKAYCRHCCPRGGDALDWTLRIAGADPSAAGVVSGYLIEQGYLAPRKSESDTVD